MIDREFAWSRGVSAPSSGFDSIVVEAGCLDAIEAEVMRRVQARIRGGAESRSIISPSRVWTC
jgi:hypothetical protein